MRYTSTCLIVAMFGISLPTSLASQSLCLHEAGVRSFNKTEWWTVFPGTERQFRHYWETHPREPDPLVGLWQMHPDGEASFWRGGKRVAPRVAIMRDCGYDGWEFVAVSVYQRGEGTPEFAAKRRILFVLRTTDESGIYAVRYPGQPFRSRDEGRVNQGNLLLLRGRDVESWFRL